MRKSRGSSTSSGFINYWRTEIVCFMPLEIEYEIHGHAWGGSQGSYEEPPDPGELEITQVRRLDPITNKEATLEEADWPFDGSETQDILDQLNEVVTPDEQDYDDSRDDYDDSHGH